MRNQCGNSGNGFVPLTDGWSCGSCGWWNSGCSICAGCGWDCGCAQASGACRGSVYGNGDDCRDRKNETPARNTGCSAKHTDCGCETPARNTGCSMKHADCGCETTARNTGCSAKHADCSCETTARNNGCNAKHADCGCEAAESSCRQRSGSCLQIRQQCGCETTGANRGVGMVWTAVQKLERIFASESALRAGTLFPELHKPMRGYCPACENCSDEAQEAAFAVWELRLYLNTHPNDKEAWALFRKLCEETEEPNYAVTFLKEMCGCDGWTWTDDPWPWEYDCNCGD